MSEEMKPDESVARVKLLVGGLVVGSCGLAAAVTALLVRDGFVFALGVVLVLWAALACHVALPADERTTS